MVKNLQTHKIMRIVSHHKIFLYNSKKIYKYTVRKAHFIMEYINFNNHAKC